MKIEKINKRDIPIQRLPVRCRPMQLYEYHSNKILCFLLVFIALPIGISSSKCQNILLDKQIIGGGGMVELANSSGAKISGLLSQTAIGRLQHTSDSDYLHIYQGFWVPNPLLNPATDSSDLMNEFINVYPNPIRSSASIYYYLPNKSLVSIKSYDILGGLVTEIYYGIQESGPKSFVWDVTDMTDGTYLINIELKPLMTHGFSSPNSSKYNKKVVILK